MKKTKFSQARKQKISLAQRGKKNSMYGKKHTKEALVKIRAASHGKNNPMFGKRHSLATRKKISLLARQRAALRRTSK